KHTPQTKSAIGRLPACPAGEPTRPHSSVFRVPAPFLQPARLSTMQRLPNAVESSEFNQGGHSPTLRDGHHFSLAGIARNLSNISLIRLGLSSFVFFSIAPIA